MKMPVRKLTDKGISGFQAWLETGAAGDPPIGLLTESHTSASFGQNPVVETQTFSSRFDIAGYLISVLGSDIDAAMETPGVWSWLSLFFIGQLAPQDASGRRKPGAVHRYLLSSDYRTYYRHLLRGGVELLRIHGENAKVLLCSPRGGIRGGEAAEELGSRQEFVSNTNLIGVAYRLYFDELAGTLKKGCTSQNKPGVIRRFVAVNQQLDPTYDLYSMTPEQIDSILPKEFDRWRNK